MSGQSGAVQSRGSAVVPRPLKATVPYQLTSKPPPSYRRDGKSAGKMKLHQQLSPGMRRTMSLDAIIGPYLQGQWLKEPEGHSSLSYKDKATQTPDSWSDNTDGRRGGSSSSSSSSSSHKRSASCGSTEQLQEITKLKQQLQQRSKPWVSGGHERESSQRSCSIGTAQPQWVPVPHAPLSTLVPRLRCSVEGLNQELEGVFVCHPQNNLLEVPDGHRAPVPPQSCSSGSQSDPTYVTTPLSSVSPSPCSSPYSICNSPPKPDTTHVLSHQGLHNRTDVFLPSQPCSQEDADITLPLLTSSSPGPNKSCCFQREPPEGCERVRVWDESSSPRKPEVAVISSCPDLNKINFTPHGGSAFCPVSLLNPLLPSMDMFFRSLSVSPAGGPCGQGPSSCQATFSNVSTVTTVSETPSV